jgi:peptidoglycan hydrolase-like protein with peptidoglycan-binding domain
MKTPLNVALDVAGNRLFVSQSDRITIFDVTEITNGENAVNILANTSYTAAAGGISSTTQSSINGLAYDATRNYLYASSLSTQRIHVYDTAVINDGEPAVSILGQGNFTSNVSYSSAGIIASSTALVYGMAQVEDKLFVSNGASDVSRVLIFDINTIADGESAVDVLGQSPSIYTRGQPSFTVGSVFNTPLNALSFYSPEGIDKDRINHRLFISDSRNNRVLVFNLNEDNVLEDYLADYVLGQPNFASSTASTTQTGLNFPQGLKFDEDGNRLFVADFNNHRVMIYDTVVIENGEPAINVLGQTGFTAATAATSQVFGRNPTDIEYDPATGRLFVSQNGSHRVAIYNIADGIINGENMIGVLGAAGYGTVINSVAQHTVPGASGLAFDSVNNRLFVSNSISTNNRPRIMVFDVATTTNGQNATYVLGQPDFTSSTASRTATGLSRPSFIAFDPVNNRLFVSDETDMRVLMYDVETITNGESATHVIGQPDFTSRDLFSTPHPARATISPRSIFYDTDTEELYVGQNFTGRISIFAAGPPDLVAPTTTQLSVANGGVSVSVEYDEILDSGSVPDIADFVLSVDGITTSVSISSISVSSSTVSLSLSTTIYSGQSVILSYSSTTNPVQDLSGNIADNFTSLIVTNNSTQAISTPTPIVSSSVGGGGGRVFVPATQPATANAIIFTRDLTLNSQGTDVYALQRFLNARGHTVSSTGAGSPGKETNVFGSLTRQALIRFQTSVGITPAIGYFGPLTRAFINKLGATPPPPTTVQTPPTTITTPTIYTRDLTLGSKGSDVTALQTYLIQKEYLQPGYATGYFGTLTQSALIKFQQANDITPAIGYFGPKTREVVGR